MAEEITDVSEPQPVILDSGGVFPLLPRNAHWEERILYFLKELPAWCIILLLLTFLVTIWLRTASGQIESYIGQALAALLTAVVTNRNRGLNSTNNQIKTDKIEADNVETANTQEGDIIAGNVTDSKKTED